MTRSPAAFGAGLPPRPGDVGREFADAQRRVTELEGALRAAIAAAMQKSANLSDVANVATARANLYYGAQLNSQAAFTNDSTERTAWTAANMPAASLSAGQTLLSVHGGGSVDVINTTGGTMKARIKVNGTNVAAVDPILAVQTSGALAAIPYWFDLRLYVDTTGAGGQVTVVGGSLIIANASATNQPRPILQQTAVNLSGGLQVSVTLQMTVANAGNTFRLTRAAANQAA